MYSFTHEIDVEISYGLCACVEFQISYSWDKGEKETRHNPEVRPHPEDVEAEFKKVTVFDEDWKKVHVVLDKEDKISIEDRAFAQGFILGNTSLTELCEENYSRVFEE